MPYNIIVTVKQVPDTKNITGGAMKEDGTVNRAALPAIFNPEDLNALEEALSIKDTHGGHVTVLTMGPPTAETVLKECLFRGADEAILVRDGFITEGAASNVFIVNGGEVKTPPVSTEILASVTRDFLIEVLNATPFDVNQCPVSEADLRAATEIWCTSSSRELFPVTKLDGEKVGDGSPGSVFGQVREMYLASNSFANFIYFWSSCESAASPRIVASSWASLPRA